MSRANHFILEVTSDKGSATSRYLKSKNNDVKYACHMYIMVKRSTNKLNQTFHTEVYLSLENDKKCHVPTAFYITKIVLASKLLKSLTT